MTPRRPPEVIALELLECVEQKGKATKWDLIKILGTGSQFIHWIENFLIKENFIQERKEGNHYFYRMTRNGNQFHELLKNGKLMKAFIQISGKRLRRK